MKACSLFFGIGLAMASIHIEILDILDILAQLGIKCTIHEIHITFRFSFFDIYNMKEEY